MLVTTEAEWLDGENVVFIPETRARLAFLGPPDHSEAPVLAVGTLGGSAVSEDVLRVWKLPAVSSADGAGRA